VDGVVEGAEGGGEEVAGGEDLGGLVSWGG
jgi:hypothetical protein